MLLGAPIGETALNTHLDKAKKQFHEFATKIQNIGAHAAFFLLKNCFALPKFLYILRTATCFKRPDLLHAIDSEVRSALSTILNVCIDEQKWSQSALPAKLGGLGVLAVSEWPVARSSHHSTQHSSFDAGF